MTDACRIPPANKVVYVNPRRIVEGDLVRVTISITPVGSDTTYVVRPITNEMLAGMTVFDEFFSGVFLTVTSPTTLRVGDRMMLLFSTTAPVREGVIGIDIGIDRDSIVYSACGGTQSKIRLYLAGAGAPNKIAVLLVYDGSQWLGTFDNC